MKRFTEQAEHILEGALEEARAMGHTYVGSAHLLLAILTEGKNAAAGLLESHGVRAARVKAAILEAEGSGTPSDIGANDISPRLRAVILRAAALMREAGAPFIGSEHLLSALLSEKESAAMRVLDGLGTHKEELGEDLAALFSIERKEGESPKRKSILAATPTLTRYGRDLTAAAAEGKIDPVIGRERETARLGEILSRRQKNNPCLIGEPGVGKTAVAEGLARRIAAGDAPPALRGKSIVSLELGAMIAGAKYRGEFEERLKTVLREVGEHPEIILFIDEIHTIVGAGAAEGAVDAANIMKPALARGDIQVIGATTLSEYRRHIEKDAALERRFQPLSVEEPTESEALAILRGVRAQYEEHHRLKIEEDALRAAVSLSVRYLPGRFLPDKALDLLDETAAHLRIAAEETPPAIREMAEELRAAAAEKEAFIRGQRFEAAAAVRDRERKLRRRYEEALAERKSKECEPCVRASDIAETVTRQTGIPAAAVSADEGTRLAHLAEELSRRVVGQEPAILRLSAAIRRSRLGLRDPRRPIGSFLFLGPTGVGKTALSRALAEALFGEERALIRFDMSEYMEKSSAAKLIGAPPGYVGYEEGGRLTEAIRRRPYAVLLFDEIEKAHPDVLNLLLQILEDGRLTDARGTRTDFCNTVIIMTSNAAKGAPTRLGFLGGGEEEKRKDSEELRRALSGSFRPEFLARIDDILLFHPLDRAAAERITEGLLADAAARAADAGLSLSFDGSVLAYLVTRGFDAGGGARYLRRTVTEEVLDALSDRLLLGEIAAGDNVLGRVENGELLFLKEERHPEKEEKKQEKATPLTPLLPR